MVRDLTTDFGPVLTAMVTPFRDNTARSLDLERAQELANYLLENGSDGVVLAGSTGEAPTLTHEEKASLFRAVKEAAGKRGWVIAGTGTYDTATSVELTREAEAAGVDAVMLVVPYYNKPSQEGIYQHFTRVAGATELPVILYNIPSRTGVNLIPGTVARLAEIDNIVALKEASGNLDQVSEIIALAGSRLQIYSGDDSLTLPLLALGCRGVISVASHLVGRQMQEMIAAFSSGQVARARRMHQQLWPLFKALFITTNPVPVKAGLDLVGQPAGPPRPPLVPATPSEREALKKVLSGLGLLS